MKKINELDVDRVVSRLSDEGLINILKEKFASFCAEREQGMDGTISFYDREVEFLRSLPSEKIKRLFYSLLCFEKLHWHESGWIRFEIDELAELGGLKNLRCEDFADLVPFGLDMRVTGSKNAVTTYYSIGLMIDKRAGKYRMKEIVDVLGTECAERFWEVVNGTC